METFARMKVSPVPAQTMFGSDSETASAPMAWTSWSSKTGRHLMPPSSVFQMPPGGCPGVVDVRVARDAGHREGPVPHRPDVPEPEPAELVRRRLGESGRGEPEGEAEQTARPEGASRYAWESSSGRDGNRRSHGGTFRVTPQATKVPANPRSREEPDPPGNAYGLERRSPDRHAQRLRAAPVPTPRVQNDSRLGPEFTGGGNTYGLERRLQPARAVPRRFRSEQSSI